VPYLTKIYISMKVGYTISLIVNTEWTL